KVPVRAALDAENPQPDQLVAAEVPLVKESAYTQTLEIPDGGTILVPVHYRPPAAAAKDRWWVLAITPQIYIEEEERAERLMELRRLLPWLFGEGMKNSG